MAIEAKHQGIIVCSTALAGIAGLLFGWAPGADVFVLALIWVPATLLIYLRSPVLGFPVTRVISASIGSAVLLMLGTEIASALTVPLFFIINPFLNAFFTYKFLRIYSKLLASDDAEELTNNLVDNMITILSLIFLKSAKTKKTTTTGESKD